MFWDCLILLSNLYRYKNVCFYYVLDIQLVSRLVYADILFIPEWLSDIKISKAYTINLKIKQNIHWLFQLATMFTDVVFLLFFIYFFYKVIVDCNILQDDLEVKSKLEVDQSHDLLNLDSESESSEDGKYVWSLLRMLLTYHQLISPPKKTKSFLAILSTCI